MGSSVQITFSLPHTISMERHWRLHRVDQDNVGRIPVQYYQHVYIKHRRFGA